jgi:hypothetical protein
MGFATVSYTCPYYLCGYKRRNYIIMMQQQSIQQLAQPTRLDIFFHSFKTVRMVGALFHDRRVSVFRKVFFVLAIVVLLAMLIFPDAIGELGLSAILPLVGTVLGIPIDAGFDWVVFAMVSVNMLRFFPPDLVAEHYSEIFR